MTAVETTDDPIGETLDGKAGPEADPSPELVLLAPSEIQFELRRLVRRLAEGAHLLRQCQEPPAGDTPDRQVLLDLEIDGVRCLLTRRGTQGNKGVSRLTTREREVAHMVAMGLTTSAIAGKLAVSPWTVSTHLRRIFAKLDVSTRAAMVAVLSEH
ncbi:helix-turn-helix transcriptional regulator [Actinoplanes sp. L3-i22]|uniref:helix-turn-helix domain-containing protein n=1 Tax=Actinoplanes sp. L3-i22 TaxID=2836373 RepID=UPI001C848FDB|nr:helix-turn-helix transcriptional regulator [Actinoplanes sp. L3-i22]